MVSSNSINIGEVSGGAQTGGVIGQLYNSVDSAGTKFYSHNNSFNIIGCSNRGNIEGGDSSGGIVGWIENTLSYAGITSKDIADTTINELIVKYCFNAGGVNGIGGTSGIIGRIYNYLGTSGLTRAAKASINISFNWNIAKIYISGNSAAGGIVGTWYNYIYGSNCYYNANTLGNINTGNIGNNGTGGDTAGILAFHYIDGVNLKSTNININFDNCYNYSINISGGSSNHRAGIVGRFSGNSSSGIALSNNYSAYKRKDNSAVDINSNIFGTATIGANVGE